MLRKKMEERTITLPMIEKVILNPDSILKDRSDASVKHLIKKIGTKYLRVLLRTENEKRIIITVFFDRRIKRS